MLGGSGGPLLAFHAPRGLGKTSLLCMAQRDAIADGFLTGGAPAVAADVAGPRARAERGGPSGAVESAAKPS